MRETPWGYITYLDYRYKVEFDEAQYRIINKYCKKVGIPWFASVWDEPAVDFLEAFDPICYKIPSASLTDHNLLRHVRKTGRPVILSTGMSTMQQIKEAVAVVGEENLLITHATSTYPCEPEELNLSVIRTLRDAFTCPIGYSGHEVGLIPTVVAVAMGACVVERHITLTGPCGAATRPLSSRAAGDARSNTSVTGAGRLATASRKCVRGEMLPAQLRVDADRRLTSMDPAR
jgi:N-acetylneuraminate synthase